MTANGAPAATWIPTPEQVAATNVGRLMRRHDVGSVAELRARSVADLSWFWDAVVRDLGIAFRSPYSDVLDVSRGIEWARWFSGGRLNLTETCLDRWADDPDAAGRPAVRAVTEGTTDVRCLSFAQLRQQVCTVATALRRHGVARGDVVALYLPMVPEAVVALYAIARVGAIALPLFSGFGADAVAARLRDAHVRLLITADGVRRRGRVVPLKDRADAAAAQAPTVRRIVVLDNVGTAAPMTPGRDVSWAEFSNLGERRPDPELGRPADTGAEDPVYLGYSSGTTGAPKGAVHVHGGFLVKVAAEAAYQTDVRPGDVLCWITDMGWIMGPWSVIGAHANGGCLAMVDGALDHPDPGRLWSSVEQLGITVLGVSPSLVRSLRRHGERWPASADLGGLRVLGIAGEPCDPETHGWLRSITGGRLPIINFSGGTEVGACFLSGHPAEPLVPCSLGGPALGMDVDVLDTEGRSVRGAVGELVCRQPWPGMTRGIWNDPERYLETYWSTYPGLWRHGDWALVEDGQWFLLGRSDDTMNVAGKRLAPAEVEAVLLTHPAVSEAAAVGVAHPAKGEAVCCFVVLTDDVPDGDLIDLVATRLGRPFAPERVVAVDALPRTISGKVLRRALRAALTGDDPGDLSGAADPSMIERLREHLRTVEEARP